MKNPIRLGVLLSGSGRTLQNLIDRVQDGSLPARIEVVISSHAGVKGLDRAAKAIRVGGPQRHLRDGRLDPRRVIGRSARRVERDHSRH